jgi:curved DNA-binding protein CbpA
MHNAKTHYELLQVSRTASKEVIDVAWKTLMREHHPDKGGDPSVAQRLNEAHDVLSDPSKRAAYDLALGPRKAVRIPRAPRAYPEAYPPAYPGVNIDPLFEIFKGRVTEAATELTTEVIEQMCRTNPWMRPILDKLRKAG